MPAWRELSVESRCTVHAAMELFRLAPTGSKVLFSGGRTGGPHLPSEGVAGAQYAERRYPDLLHEENTLIIVSHDVTSTAIISDHLWLMGREREEASGKIIPGSKILKEFSLIERDLAWHPDIEKTQEFTDFVKEVKSLFPLL